MAISAAKVANSLLSRGNRDGVAVDPMKLQKLLYLAHGWHLAFLHQPLITEDVEAWSYGPVVPDIYREFKEFKAAPITRPAAVLPGTLGTTETEESLIESVWNTYKDKSGIYLSMLTHEPGYAWDIARRDASGWGSPIIPNELILDEFKRRQQAAQGS